ncbi:hypothetical protein GCM10027515_11920 [Schumannella luteola]
MLRGIEAELVFAVLGHRHGGEGTRPGHHEVRRTRGTARKVKQGGPTLGTPMLIVESIDLVEIEAFLRREVARIESKDLPMLLRDLSWIGLHC